MLPKGYGMEISPPVNSGQSFEELLSQKLPEIYFLFSQKDGVILLLSGIFWAIPKVFTT